MSSISTWPQSLLFELSGLQILKIRPRNRDRLLPHMKLHSPSLLALPRSLTDLELGFKEAICDEDLLALPQTLTRLWLPWNTRISPSGLVHLPPQLETLSLERNLLISDASMLPRQLLHYAFNPRALAPTASTANNLPLRLIRLSTGLEIDQENENPWELCHLSLLASHSSLIRLDLLIDTPKTFTLHTDFPPNLEALVLRGFDIKLPGALVAQLPRGLLELRITASKANACSFDWEDAVFGDLPRGLTTLQISRRYEPSLMHSAITAQPSLDLIQGLPPKLRSLSLPWVFVEPSRSQDWID